MTGTLQLMFYALLAGVTLGFGYGHFRDQHWAFLLCSCIFWIVFLFNLANAAWLARWGQKRDWVDRIGVLVRGVGFACVSLAAALVPKTSSVALGVVGMVIAILGRAIWELLAATISPKK